MDISTHEKISKRLVGRPIEVVRGMHAIVELNATNEMAVDLTGLTHGGFTFGLADYAAMLAVNHPNVVLGSAQVKFTAPVKTGDTMRAEATVTNMNGKKSEVSVEVKVGEQKVFSGIFLCYSLETHVLEKS